VVVALPLRTRGSGSWVGVLNLCSVQLGRGVVWRCFKFFRVFHSVRILNQSFIFWQLRLFSQSLQSVASLSDHLLCHPLHWHWQHGLQVTLGIKIGLFGGAASESGIGEGGSGSGRTELAYQIGGLLP
jgi:hypothetical protein